MPPDFNKSTVDTLAKRAAFRCSNPDCRAATVGPNGDPDKYTLIGEAAHIFGARSRAARFVSDMTDYARSEITNAIWLCRNCHKLVDQDEKSHPANLLFEWREDHERFVLSQLGSPGDVVRDRTHEAELLLLKDYPPIVRRIAIDKPPGWEYRLAAELMRTLNKPAFRRLKDLRNGLYINSLEPVARDDGLRWLLDRLSEMERLIGPMSGILSSLTLSFGDPGEPGDVQEIHHNSCLLRDSITRVVEHEERLSFVKLDEIYLPALQLLQGRLATQTEKLATLPDQLDEIVSKYANRPADPGQPPETVAIEVVFELPDDWGNRFNRELRKIERALTGGDPLSGCSMQLVGWIVGFLFIYLLFF